MDLLYVAIINSEVIGVTNKIKNFVSAAKESNLNVKAIIVSDKPNKINIGSEIEFVHANISNVGFSFLGKKKERVFYQKLDEYIEKNHPDVPFIYFRYLYASAALNKFLIKYGKKVIFEHNSIELRELKLLWKNYSVKDFLYNLRRLNFSILYANLKCLAKELRWSIKVRQAVLGGIAVTSEIGNYQNKLAENERYILEIIPNATNNINAEINNQIKTNVNEFVFVFVAGHANVWHGIDRFLKGMGQYKGSQSIRLIYIGRKFSYVDRLIKKFSLQDSITEIPTCPQDKLIEYFQHADMAISTLALHRIPLQQGCVLKTREYLSYGLPVILSYEDEELEAIPIVNKFLYHVKANDFPIDIQEIIESYESRDNKLADRNSISKCVITNTGYVKKTLQLKIILSTLANSQS